MWWNSFAPTWKEPRTTSQIRFSASLVVMLRLFASGFWFPRMSKRKETADARVRSNHAATPDCEKRKRSSTKAPLSQWRQDYQPTAISDRRTPMWCWTSRTDHAWALVSRNCAYRTFWHLRKTVITVRGRQMRVAWLLCYPCFATFSISLHDSESEKSLQTDEERSYEVQYWSYICEKALDRCQNYVEDWKRGYADEILLRGIG